MAGNHSQNFLRYFTWDDCLYSDKNKPKGLSPDAFYCREVDREDGLSFYMAVSGLETKEGEFHFQQVGPRSGKDCWGVANTNFGNLVREGKCENPKHSPDDKHPFGKLHYVIPCPDDDEDLRLLLSQASKLLRYVQKADANLPASLEEFKLKHGFSDSPMPTAQSSAQVENETFHEVPGGLATAEVGSIQPGVASDALQHFRDAPSRRRNVGFVLVAAVVLVAVAAWTWFRITH